MELWQLILVFTALMIILDAEAFRIIVIIGVFLYWISNAPEDTSPPEPAKIEQTQPKPMFQ